MRKVKEIDPGESDGGAYLGHGLPSYGVIVVLGNMSGIVIVILRDDLVSCSGSRKSRED